METKKAIIINRSKRREKYWLESKEGKRLTPKFVLIKKTDYGPYRVINTSNGSYVYNEIEGTILYEDTPHKYDMCFVRIAQNLYKLSYSMDDKDKRAYKMVDKTYLLDGNSHVITDEYVYVSKLLNERIVVKKEYLKEYPVTDEHSWIKKEFRYGYIDEDAKTLTPCEYIYATDYNKYGYAIAIREDNQSVVLNKSGQEVLRTVCKISGFITKDLFKVINNSKVGVVNINGNIIVPPAFDSVTFKDKKFYVEGNKKYGIIDIDGTVILKCVYDKIEETEEDYIVTELVTRNISKRPIDV